MGVAAMMAAMLRLPLTSVLITSVFLADAGLNLLPLVIVAVVVGFAASSWLIPAYLPAPARRN